MGDANLCSKNWSNTSATHKKMANKLIESLNSCGLAVESVGPTFISDHIQSNGSITESWLDHVYHNEQQKEKIKTKVLNYGSSDHLPVITYQATLVKRKAFKT